MPVIREASDEHFRVGLRAAEVEVGTEGAATVRDAINDERRLHAVTTDFYSVPAAVVHGPAHVDLNPTVASVDDVQDEANSSSSVHHLRDEELH